MLCVQSLSRVDCSLSGTFVLQISQARILKLVAFLPQGDLPDPSMVPTSPALHADSLPLIHQGSPHNL